MGLSLSYNDRPGIITALIRYRCVKGPPPETNQYLSRSGTFIVVRGRNSSTPRNGCISEKGLILTREEDS